MKAPISVGHFDWLRKHHTDEEMRRTLGRIYRVACERLALKPDDSFVDQALADTAGLHPQDPARRLIHRLFTYKLAIALRRGSKDKPGMKWAAVALFLNMSEDALRTMLYRIRKDRRKTPRGADRRNVDGLYTDNEQDVA